MNCDEVTALLAADADGEVDGLRSHAIGKHLAGCTACARRHDAGLALKQRLRAELPYHRPPAALRARLMSEHPRPGWPAGAAKGLRAPRWRWFGSGLATGAMAAGVVWAASVVWLPGGFGDDLSARVVGLHTRATLGNHLIDVASSDRHKVRPWLSARLDYAVPVTDWAATGFPLLGARLDRLDGHAVAVLVYRHRDHIIDVFVRPDAAAAAPPAVRSVRGFNVAAAHGAEMQWLAASDLNGAELAAFARGLAAGKVEPVAE